MMLSSVCIIVGPPAVHGASIYVFPCAIEKAQTIAGGHPQLGALKSVMWCFVSSLHQGFRGVLHRHHCVKLTGPRCVAVTVHLLSGVRGMRWRGRNASFISAWHCLRPCT